MRRTNLFKHAMQLGLTLAICMAPSHLLTKSYAQPPQAATPAMEAADQAYREVTEKNYTEAIRDFRKALAAEPSNAQWRKDLGFACLAAGFADQALPEFQKVYAEHPEDSATALQLGYLSQQLRKDEDAKKYFELAARSADPQLAAEARKVLEDLQASQRLDRKQRAYDLLAQKRTREAMELFESIHKDDPADATVSLQLGYLYASAGRRTEAKQMFLTARQDADPKVTAQANAGLDQVSRDSKLWFASVYAAPFYQSHFSNEINAVTASVGLKPSRYFEPYLGLRFTRDVRSRTGTLPLIYSDNSAVLSAGIQSLLANSGAAAYAEAGIAVNLMNQGPRAVPDYRAGLRWSRSWGRGLFQPGNQSQAVSPGRAVSPVGSAYADAAYYTRYGDNVIGYVQLREGLNLPAPRRLPMQLLAAINFVKDSRGQFYNNVAEAGPELRIGLLRQVPGLSLEAQYLRGFYVTHTSANPYGPRYGDVRVFLIWSHSF